MTGSSRGIGAAIALRLAQHGANVAVNYVSSAEAAEKVAEQIRGHGVKAIVIKADVSKEEEIRGLFEKAIEEFGHLDIVMSNSGIEHFGAVADVTGEEIDRVFATNVKAQYFVAKQAYLKMAESGRLILISSISAQRVSSTVIIEEREFDSNLYYSTRVFQNMQSIQLPKQQFKAWSRALRMTLVHVTSL